ncbi:MAG: response regulator transcription factor [Ignavibacteriae bacterium]|nr:response regulator transcription factor [Ignavibacteriota bacterium]
MSSLKSIKNSSGVPTVLLIDSRPVIRQALKLFLISDIDVDVIAVEDIQEAIALLEKQSANESEMDNVDIIMIDMVWARNNILDIIQSLRLDFADIPVLVINTGYDDKFASRVMKMGASGYKSSPSSIEQFHEAIQVVIAGRKYISPSVTKQILADTFQKGGMMPHEILSDREFQTMSMIASGKTVGEISKELVLSVKTISTYRTRILEKMHLKNNSEIVQYAVRNNLI